MYECEEKEENKLLKNIWLVTISNQMNRRKKNLGKPQPQKINI